MENTSQKWVVTINNRGDKVLSHIVTSDNEQQARKLAVEWVTSEYGDYNDWTLHKICAK